MTREEYDAIKAGWQGKRYESEYQSEPVAIVLTQVQVAALDLALTPTDGRVH